MTTLQKFDVQIGKQSAFGTAVAPTKLLQGVTSVTFNPLLSREVHQFQDGSLAPSDTDLLGSDAVTGSIEAVASYEMLPYFLNLLCSADNTPTGVGPYVYNWAAPVGAGVIPTNDYYTLVYSDATYEYNAVGIFAKNFTFSGSQGENATFALEFDGYGFSEATSRAALTSIALTPLPAWHVALYIDNLGGTIGTTLVSNELNSFELSISSESGLVFSADSKNPIRQNRPKWMGSLGLSMLLDTTSAGMLTTSLTEAGAKKLIQLKATSGTNILEFDFAGLQTGDIEVLGENESEALLEFEFTRILDSGAFGNWFKASATNNLTTPF